VTSKKSAAKERFDRVQPTQDARPFWPQLGPVVDAGSFTVGFVVTGTLILFGGVLALLLRLPANHGKEL
jgi:hypothetical protein